MKDRPERLYEIQYTKAAEKFLKDHEDVRSKFRDAIRAFLDGARPENVDIKKIRGKRNDYKTDISDIINSGVPDGDGTGEAGAE